MTTNEAPTVDAVVPFWYTKLGEEEQAAAADAIRQERLSQGPLTAEFESRLAAFLDVPYVVATTSGSVALYMAFASLGIGPGDEVIVPNRTFIATAHAVLMTGAKVKLVDCKRNSTIIDETQIENAITPRTKAIAPVHLNGNAADIDFIRSLAKKHGLLVVEDAAQAFASRSNGSFLGTQSDAGCWSLGVTKLITTGQGGFVCTRDPAVYEKLVLFRSHGVFSTFAASYKTFGFNFKFNDVAAAIGLVQLRKVPQKIERHAAVYRWYKEALADLPFMRLLPVEMDAGRLPLWVEALCSEREAVIAELDAQNIQVRPFLPDLSESPHLENDDAAFVNSKRFARHGVFLPVGPDLPLNAMERTVAALRRLRPKIKPADDVASF